jgi:hypothetical protein
MKTKTTLALDPELLRNAKLVAAEKESRSAPCSHRALNRLCAIVAIARPTSVRGNALWQDCTKAWIYAGRPSAPATNFMSVEPTSKRRGVLRKPLNPPKWA